MEYIKIYLIPFIDILIVAYLIYIVYKSIVGTRTIQILKGVLLIAISYFIGRFLELETFLWLFTKALEVAAIALLIIFQHDLRRIIMRLGENIPIFKSYLDDTEKKNIKTIITASYNMAQNKIGALIVIENNTKLGGIIEKGIKLDALISRELIESIFTPRNPLHDGAIIITEDKIAASSCFLPLTERTDLSTELGTRHRAALGLSEDSDAVIVIASEENGSVSIVYDNEIFYNLPKYSCEDLLKRLLHDEEYKENKLKSFFKTVVRKNKKNNDKNISNKENKTKENKTKENKTKGNKTK